MRALVVDVEPVVLNAMARTLRDQGWSVAAVNNFRDARHLLSTAPHLLVAEIRLGDFNGLQLAILARELDPNVRVLMVSDYDDPVLRRDATSYGAGFLLKPFTPQEFVSTVARDTALEPSV